MRDKNLQVYENAKIYNVYHRCLCLFLIKPICSVLESAAEKSEMEVVSTMQNRCLCRSFVRTFRNALFYVACLAFHC